MCIYLCTYVSTYVYATPMYIHIRQYTRTSIFNTAWLSDLALSALKLPVFLRKHMWLGLRGLRSFMSLALFRRT